MPWQVSGQLIENCSCNMFCPCWYTVPELMIMDQGWCRTSLTSRIQQGNADGVDLSGRTVTIVADFPGPTLFDGKATARAYIDDGASPDQQRALDAIFTGKQGGPMAILASLVETWLPTQTVPIEVQDDGDTIRVKVGDAGQVRSQLLRDSSGADFTLRGGGFITAFGLDGVSMAPSAGTRWADPGIPAYETKSGARGNMKWSG